MRKGIALTLVLVVVLPMMVVVVAGCGGVSPQEADAKFKSDLQNLQTAFLSLANPSNYTNIDSFKSAWKNVEKAYDEVVKSAKDVKNANTSALKKAWDDLSATIGSINSTQSLTQMLDTITKAFQDFQTALQDLYSPVETNQ
jgi:hypothetical protein